MANQVTLMEYLQHGLPVIPLVPPPRPGHNTTNQAYRAADITHTGVWADFSLQTVLQRYQNILTATTLPWDPFPATPPPPVTVENALRHRLTPILMDRMRRALRAGFNQMHATNQLQGYTPLSLDVGESSLTPDGFIPDFTYLVVSLVSGTGPNRAPGDVKPSWKWNTAMATGGEFKQKEFRQVLSQVNWYMKQHNSRYGFVITDLEMVAIRRLDNNGRLELSAAIPWEVGGGQQPRLTVMLALWYLGMLAAQDQGPNRWTFN
ncbi:hypothetical protein FQN54_005664 [Arachnomyces sp. PD_36]|nr:hypothetical protein FQN54_005664 [Arachnomyces sp. PD_36]